MKRTFDVCGATIGLLATAPVMFLIAIAIRLTSPGPILHWSNRVGQGNVLFEMPKFRTMSVGTPQLATHLLLHSDSHITPVGRLLRKTSLDELPQLWSVLIGDMSFVGPRPALYNQYDLITLRTSYSVHKLVPGITGWAQINGRDELSISDKVEFDASYMRQMSLRFDFKILLQTFVKVFQREGICQAELITNQPVDLPEIKHEA